MALRAPSAVRFAAGAVLTIPDVETVAGPAAMWLRTRRVEEAAGWVPADLVVEVAGSTEADLTAAANGYGAAAAGLLPVLAVAANAPVGPLDIAIAYEAGEAPGDHEFFQHLMPEDRLLRHGRQLDPAHALALVTAVQSHPERDRLLRVCAFYREALGHLTPGDEAMCVLHLWLAVEAMTPVALAVASRETGSDRPALARRWGVGDGGDANGLVPGLDGEARRRLVFHGDATCQRLTAAASDGLRQGSKDLEAVRRLAMRALAAGAAGHVRRAILECARPGPEVVAALTAASHAVPRAHTPYSRWVRGTISGGLDPVGENGTDPPGLRWSGQLASVREREDGVFAVTGADPPVEQREGGPSIRVAQSGAWGPETDIVEAAPAS